MNIVLFFMSPLYLNHICVDDGGLLDLSDDFWMEVLNVLYPPKVCGLYVGVSLHNLLNF